jgi:two-component system copper resistance phosphate regulon response regulator CusR
MCPIVECTALVCFWHYEGTIDCTKPRLFMKVLIFEEQTGNVSPLTQLLSQKGIEYRIISRGISPLTDFDHDLLIIDVCYPERDGSDTCSQWRRQLHFRPILILSALGDPQQKVKGLDAGADDYLVKPYHPDELLARMKALTRLKRQEALEPIKKAGEVELDTFKRTVTRHGKSIDLTGREFALLDLLISHKNKVLPRSYISEVVWGINFNRRTNLVDVYIKYLRKKIDANANVPHIHTVVGRGYVFKDG